MGTRLIRRTVRKKSRSISLISAIVVLVGITVAVPGAASAEDHPEGAIPSRHVGTLNPGTELFWNGEFVKDSLNPLFGTQDFCGTPSVLCFDYTFDIVGTGDRLRIALDDKNVYEFFSLWIKDPSGVQVEGPGPIATWSKEYLIEDPAEGAWTARVVAEVAEDADFRMRAKLEEIAAESSSNRPSRPLLPNMRLTPPWEFTFSAPLSIGGPGLEVNGTPLATCSATETATQRSGRCLRFSMGPQNVGEGPLDLIYTPTASAGDPVPVTQYVHQEQGEPQARDAGTAEYHSTHAHYHHNGFGLVEIHRVLDEKKGDLELVGTSPKQGYCIANYLIVEWHEFTQASSDTTSTCNSRTETPGDGSRMYLPEGWSDIYGWSIDYNYVEFGGQPDGLYLVRSTTDPADVILETDEKDNTSYALIDVQGNSITLLERGYGQGPWDPHREVVDDGWLPANADTKWVPFNDLI